MIAALSALVLAPAFAVKRIVGLPMVALEQRWGKPDAFQITGRFWRGDVRRLPVFREALRAEATAPGWAPDGLFGWTRSEAFRQEGFESVYAGSSGGRLMLIALTTLPLPGSRAEARKRLFRRIGMAPPPNATPEVLLRSSCMGDGYFRRGWEFWTYLFNEKALLLNGEPALRLSAEFHQRGGLSPQEDRGEAVCQISQDSQGQDERVVYEGLPFDAQPQNSLARVGLSARGFRWIDASKEWFALESWPEWRVSWSEARTKDNFPCRTLSFVREKP